MSITILPNVERPDIEVQMLQSDVDLLKDVKSEINPLAAVRVLRWKFPHMPIRQAAQFIEQL